MSAKKILVVDDEVELVELIQMRLEAAGYDVVVAHDGYDGFEAAQKQNPDCIILDLMLPKMDGYRVCGLLKANTRYRKIPIIMFTAKAQESDRVVAAEVGADAYLTKPFEPDILLAKIEELLQVS